LLLALLAGVQLAEPFATNPDDALLGVPKGSQKVLLPQPNLPANPPSNAPQAP
jgi:hypothetical protein